MPIADAAGPSNQAPAEAAATASTSRHHPRRSNKASADQPTEACEPHQAAEKGPPGKAALGAADYDEAEDGDTDAVASGKSLEELAVRFSQATKELQVRPLGTAARCLDDCLSLCCIARSRSAVMPAARADNYLHKSMNCRKSLQNTTFKSASTFRVWRWCATACDVSCMTCGNFISIGAVCSCHAWQGSYPRLCVICCLGQHSHVAKLLD